MTGEGKSDQDIDFPKTLVYAPIGAAIRLVGAMPGLVALGRERLVAQLPAARAIGRMAVGTARKRLQESLSSNRTQDVKGQVITTSATSLEACSDKEGELAGSDRLATTAATGQMRTEVGTVISGYDSLAASQVVARLLNLSENKLEVIQSYEEATRARRTILGRISQIRGERSGTPN